MDENGRGEVVIWFPFGGGKKFVGKSTENHRKTHGHSAKPGQVARVKGDGPGSAGTLIPSFPCLLFLLIGSLTLPLS